MGQFGNSREGERLPLGAVTMRLLKIMTEDAIVCV
jgi:hypothetical protein